MAGDRGAQRRCRRFDREGDCEQDGRSHRLEPPDSPEYSRDFPGRPHGLHRAMYGDHEEATLYQGETAAREDSSTIAGGQIL